MLVSLLLCAFKCNRNSEDHNEVKCACKYADISGDKQIEVTFYACLVQLQGEEMDLFFGEENEKIATVFLNDEKLFYKSENNMTSLGLLLDFASNIGDTWEVNELGPLTKYKMSLREIIEDNFVIELKSLRAIPSQGAYTFKELWINREKGITKVVFLTPYATSRSVTCEF